MEEIQFIIKLVLGIILGIILVVVITGFGIYLVDRNVACPRYSESVNLEYRYNFWAGGCFVNYHGQWIPSKNLRAGKLD